jgi:2-succinyl-5-enolpyruvyl-6-hydroxy-3-cyclohexene-1-carboxylate synthase
MNLLLAQKILKSCADLGVKEFCLCAGARNAPFIFLLAKAKGVRVFNFFEERSAAFFALGRIKADGQPVAVITTSGTAVAELLPAAVEATYAGLPLLMITADRPRRFRRSGAPQAIEQVGIFSHYVETCWDVESTDDDLMLSTWSRTQPLQINVCFDEPLIDGELVALDLTTSEIEKLPPPIVPTPMVTSQIRRVPKPLIIVGGLKSWDIPGVVNFLKSVEAPIFAESISQLRGQAELEGHLLTSDKLIPQLIEEGICHSILRIGGVPTLRFWRDLEDKFNRLPVYSCSNEDWTGLSRPTRHVVGLSALALFQVDAMPSDELQQIRLRDQELSQKFQELLRRFPHSEVALLAQLAAQIAGQAVYLGNSLPIREWDLASPVKAQFLSLDANRGANGIDGQISTFLGWSEKSVPAAAAWAVLGDLTTLYDSTGLWITPHLKPGQRRLVVINNHGGQIFKNIFEELAFINAHQIKFQKWAEQWNWAYQQWREIPADLHFSDPNLVIELKPDAVSSDQFWQEYRRL